MNASQPNIGSCLSKSGKKINFRLAGDQDLKSMWDYINKISKEKTYITFQGETVTLEEEKSFLDEQLSRIQSKTSFMLLAFDEEKLVGICGIDMLERIESHIGELGLSIDKGYRGEGIGKNLCETVINNAKNYLPKLSHLTLKVYSENTPAIDLYVKLGFEHFGTLPESVNIQGETMDILYMYRVIS